MKFLIFFLAALAVVALPLYSSHTVRVSVDVDLDSHESGTPSQSSESASGQVDSVESESSKSFAFNDEVSYNTMSSHATAMQQQYPTVVPSSESIFSIAFYKHVHSVVTETLRSLRASAHEDKHTVMTFGKTFYKCIREHHDAIITEFYCDNFMDGMIYVNHVHTEGKVNLAHEINTLMVDPTQYLSSKSDSSVVIKEFNTKHGIDMTTSVSSSDRKLLSSDSHKHHHRHMVWMGIFLFLVIGVLGMTTAILGATNASAFFIAAGPVGWALVAVAWGTLIGFLIAA